MDEQLGRWAGACREVLTREVVAGLPAAAHPVREGDGVRLHHPLHKRFHLRVSVVGPGEPHGTSSSSPQLAAALLRTPTRPVARDDGEWFIHEGNPFRWTVLTGGEEAYAVVATARTRQPAAEAGRAFGQRVLLGLRQAGFAA